MEAKKSYSTAISTKMAQVQSIEIEDKPVLEDVGSDPISKVVEELEQVSADQGDEEKFFLVGTSLSPKEKENLVWLLKQNVEVFA